MRNEKSSQNLPMRKKHTVTGFKLTSSLILSKTVLLSTLESDSRRVEVEAPRRSTPSGFIIQCLRVNVIIVTSLHSKLSLDVQYIFDCQKLPVFHGQYSVSPSSLPLLHYHCTRISPQRDKSFEAEEAAQ